MAWNGLPLNKANQLLNPLKVQIAFNEEEGGYVARHPNNGQVIRRPNITDCFLTVLTNWIQLKDDGQT